MTALDVAKLTEIPPVEVLTETGAATTNPDEAMTGAVATKINKIKLFFHEFKNIFNFLT